MKRVPDKFDKIDNKRDDLKNKRRQLRKTLSKEAETPLGRLNQLKVASAAHTFDLELEKAKTLKRAEREKIDKELAEKVLYPQLEAIELEVHHMHAVEIEYK